MECLKKILMADTKAIGRGITYRLSLEILDSFNLYFLILLNILSYVLDSNPYHHDLHRVFVIYLLMPILNILTDSSEA